MLDDLREPVEGESIDRLKLAQNLLRQNFHLIRLADSKAQFLLRITLTLFGVAFIGVPPAVAALKQFLYAGGFKFILFIAVIVLYAICAGFLMVAIAKVVKAVRPRNHRIMSELSGQTLRASCFFVESIAGKSFEEFRDTVNDIEYDSAVNETIHDIHVTALIAVQKYKLVDQAIKWMLGGGLFGVLFALILLVSWQLLDATPISVIPVTPTSP